MSQINEKINDIIINKVRELTASLENEAEIARIKDKMECIEQGLKILKLLREQETGLTHNINDRISGNKEIKR